MVFPPSPSDTAIGTTVTGANPGGDGSRGAAASSGTVECMAGGGAAAVNILFTFPICNLARLHSAGC